MILMSFCKILDVTFLLWLCREKIILVFLEMHIEAFRDEYHGVWIFLQDILPSKVNKYKKEMNKKGYILCLTKEKFIN